MGASPTFALVEGRDYRHTASFDYAHGAFADGYEQTEEPAVHSRSVLYVRDRYWIVLDHLKTDRPRELQVLWHYAPDCRVLLDGKDAVSVNPEEANLRIVPLGSMEWEAGIVKGQESPFIQGWYSEHYGAKVASPTVIYSTKISQSATFAWLLVPALGETPSPNVGFRQEAGKVIISIEEKDGKSIQCILYSCSQFCCHKAYIFELTSKMMPFRYLFFNSCCNP